MYSLKLEADMEVPVYTICLILSIIILVIFFQTKIVSAIILIVGIVSTVSTLTMILSAIFLNIMEWWKDKYGKKN